MLRDQCLSQNIISGIPQRLTPLFGKYKIKPTYLISPEVLNDEDSVSLLKSMKNCELGTHLHCEFIDPDANFNSITTLRTQNTLTYEIEYKKISNLTDLFKNDLIIPHYLLELGDLVFRTTHWRFYQN